MLNTDKSIKNATDSELQEMLSRIRKEREALRLIRGVKLLSEPNQKGPYPNYSTLEAFSTETPVNNGKSIKDMTNEELLIFIRRLQNEDELMQIVRDIKEMNTPTISIEDGVYFDKGTYEGIDLNTPVKDLYHFGIPGMRWGVRRARGASGRVSTSSEDHLTSRQLKKKKTKELSNAELKALNNRLNLERNLRDLKISDSQKGLEFVKTITAVGTTLAAAYALSETPLGKATISAIKGKLKKGG